MDVFAIRDRLIGDYAEFVESFINIKDRGISDYVDDVLTSGALWPEPLIQLNPSFAPGESLDALISDGVLHAECAKIFRVKSKDDPHGVELRFHKHQTEAIRVARADENYVLTTGTGSGKSLAYIVPIVDHVLRRGSGKGIQAIVVYPMNALANSQRGELEKFLCLGYPNSKPPVTFARYTGQESDEEKQEIIANPPDILLTNYVMLEYILTRPRERQLINSAKGLKFLVLDELHTYRGRQGADVAMLVRRVRDRLATGTLQCVGTSATLAGAGSFDTQRAGVAAVATKLFGSQVKPECVIGETLERATVTPDLNDANFIAALKRCVDGGARQLPTDYATFIADPLASWIESIFGVVPEEGTGRLIRATPRSINSSRDDGGPVAVSRGAASDLGSLTGAPEERCAAAIRATLLAGTRCAPNVGAMAHPFAFRLHQFISRGDTVYSSIEPEEHRHVTVFGQQFVPGGRKQVLLPLVFCRECGQEFYSVWAHHGQAPNGEAEPLRYVPRRYTELKGEDADDSGFLYASNENPWPSDAEQVAERLPDDWFDEKGKVLANRRGALPRPTKISPTGIEDEAGLDCTFIPAPFRFCPSCGVAYDFRSRSDIGKLSSLGTEGRSTATTMLSLNAVRALREADELSVTARKLLSFTDNRQDASLQAGHFNDFVEIGVLRAALLKAVSDAGPHGLDHDDLAEKVFDSLSMPLARFAANPDVRFAALEDTKKAMRNVLAYRIYRDLRRGWRLMSPNLEQCGLLEIGYQSLGDLCASQDVWQTRHAVLAAATPEKRVEIATVLLDFMRRELAVKVDYLSQTFQEKIQQQSSQYLMAPWALDENEEMEHAAILFPRPRRGSREHVYLSGRSGFGQYLRRAGTFGDVVGKLPMADVETIIAELLECLCIGGQVARVSEPEKADQVPGYQVLAGALRWVAGSGERAFHDPIRVPREPEAGRRTNPFFVDFYTNVAGTLHDIEAHEHTAQVPYPEREKREVAFREGRLPVLYCSPTMELGVDISQLNAVNMRNVPPTPANYAQRSGRAGRSGQPALVFTYCSTGNSHDQYFFKRPEQMVAGAVTPPRLDLANEDLVRAHVQAMWLAASGLSLGMSLKELLEVGEVEGGEPTLELLEGVKADIEAPKPRETAKVRARAMLTSLGLTQAEAPWYDELWVDRVMDELGLEFERACGRWRTLYRSARKQYLTQTAVIVDASRSSDDKKRARGLRREAEAQLNLLLDTDSIAQSDFYSYRYFASEGFLPGYNFPRLPLSAFIPARKALQRDEFLSRPRFLAISEFGPRASVYHEGSRYVINKVILPVSDDDPLTTRLKLCGRCGYLHHVNDQVDFDLCERCHAPLSVGMDKLFRLQNVSTRRLERINCDEEERQRQGYEIVSGFRFELRDGLPDVQTAEVVHDGAVIATLAYGHAATIWRINRGWRRRKNPAELGFVLDLERGYWAKNEQQEADQDDPMSPKQARVIPYVEDRRNCLVFEPTEQLSSAEMASLQSALKSAIQVAYQLEDAELAAEPLPSMDDRRILLFFESAEGGAGALRRFIEDSAALGRVARTALDICHFDSETGVDLGRAPHSRDECEAACYDCLMTYSNQRDHLLLDRKSIHPLLMALADATVAVSPANETRAEHLARLERQAGSELEKEWLRYVDHRGLRLPDRAQMLIEECSTRPDFYYEDGFTTVYVDGPHHKYPERAKRDVGQTGLLEECGYRVLRFGIEDDWDSLVEKCRSVFGDAVPETEGLH
jgi:ATP-dependent helicase YprA (DUF1998 family)/very-short-patch-repair endonuclease